MSFIQFARAHGLEIADLQPLDKIQRCPTTEKPRQKNGAFHWDGERGWVFNWSGEKRAQWYQDPDAKPWTEEEKQAWKQKRAAARAEQERSHQRAAIRAGDMLRDTRPGQHDYLVRKRLAEVQGLVLPDGALLVPMRNMHTNALQGAQIIRWNPEDMRWEKKMLPGMRAKGAVLRLGSPKAAETVFCEGYATGLSIELALRQMRLNAAVLVCFSDVNMVHVASQPTRGRRYVFADHDDIPKPERDKRAAGQSYEARGPGELAAIETGLPYCMSDVLGFDANDLHARDGLLSVCALLMQVRQQEMAVL